MIQSGTVAIAKSAPRMRAQWLVGSAVQFLFQFLFPAAKTQLELSIWATSLQHRPDGRLVSLIVDGCIGWFGLLCGMLISCALYRLALDQWRGVETPWSSLACGTRHLQSFLALSLVASVGNEISWFYIGAHLPVAGAIAGQLVLTWVVITPFLFVVPLIVDRELPVVLAIRLSIHAVSKQPVAAFLLMLGAGFWSYIGVVACIVGAIFTMPTYQLAVSRAYLDVFEPSEPTPDGAPAPM